MLDNVPTGGIRLLAVSFTKAIATTTSLPRVVMYSNLTKYSTVVASKDQVSCEFSGESVVLNLQVGMYYGLNAVGARIWGLIQQPISVEQICDVIEQEYEVDPVRCRHDVLALVDKMTEEGLAEVKSAIPA